VENVFSLFGALPSDLECRESPGLVYMLTTKPLFLRRDWHSACNYAKRSTLLKRDFEIERRQKMAAITLYTCLCGVQKKTSNHWVLAKVSDNGITFMPWDAELARRGDIVVLCGEGCAASMLSRSLGDWKKPAVGVTSIGSITDISAEYELAVA
jgi:hypothetical protein